MFDEALALKQFLEILALVSTAIGFPLAVIQVYLGRKEAQASRDLEIILNLSEAFRSRWERSWRLTLKRLRSVGYSRSSEVDQEELVNMLNWVDWLGNLIHDGELARGSVVLTAVGPQIRKMLEIGREKVQQDVEEHGHSYWRGLFVVAERLKPPADFVS